MVKINNRLKLYDDTLILSINKKDKNKFRKIAFKNKKTMSEFNRLLIKLIIRIDEVNKRDNENIKLYKDINNLLLELGRDNK